MNTEIHQAPRPLREIRAVFTESTVRVYQAFGNEIAISALERQAFFPPFKLDGITSWIKPSFLWTMARTGWGRYTRIGAGRREHEGNAKVLGVDIDRAFFGSLLESNWAAITKRCKNASPSGCSKNAATTGETSNESFLANQCRRVVRGTPNSSDA